jgi:hypothetical protein
MKRFVEGSQRGQSDFFPSHLEDFIDEDNQASVVNAFVEADPDVPPRIRSTVN